MKGLLLKDYYMASKYCRLHFVIMVIFAVVSMGYGNLFLLVYPAVVVGMVPVSLIAYDEKSKWDVYAGVFPYTKKELVSVKYILMLAFLGVEILLLAGTQTVMMVLQGNFELRYLIKIIAMVPFLGLLSPCVMLPSVYKYGVEKGRILYYVMIIVISGAIGAVGVIGEEKDIVGMFIDQNMWAAVAMLLAAAVMLAVSWNLSVKFYEKKEIAA